MGRSLTYLSIPVLLQKLDISALINTAIRTIMVETGNPVFRADGNFLLKADELSILRYFGLGSAISIQSESRELSTSQLHFLHSSSA
jgi:hypothetical protein